jgi:hypothetical protein
MTFAGIIAEFRSQLDDKQAPYLWSLAEISAYLNSAIDEACERALLIEDRTTIACCQISLTAGVSSYPLHDSVLRVKRVVYDGFPLAETSVEMMDCAVPSWETLSGRPSQYLMTETNIRLVPTPTVDSVAATSSISMTVNRTHLVPFTDATPETTTPEVKSLYHMRLMPWMYRCALMKKDSETLDEPEAARQEAIFERSFGIRPDANVQRKHRDKRPHIVKAIF